MNILDKEVHITIKESELTELLTEKLLVKEPDKLASLIMGLLNSSFAAAQLYKALQGIYPVLKYKIGDAVYVKFERLADWRYDKEKTLALPGVLDEKYIPCRIETTNLYKESAYMVVYNCIKGGHTEMGEDSYEIQENVIHSKIENFEEVIEQLEQYKQNNT